jgi:hypothetical protein
VHVSFHETRHCARLCVPGRQIKRHRTRGGFLHFYYREMEISPGCRHGEWLQGGQWSSYCSAGACLISPASRDMAVRYLSIDAINTARTHKTALPRKRALGLKFLQSWTFHSLESLYKPRFSNGRQTRNYNYHFIFTIQINDSLSGFKQRQSTYYCSLWSSGQSSWRQIKRSGV